MNSGICPVCGSADYNICGRPSVNQISKDFMDKEYKVVQCSFCTSYFVDPQIEFTDKQWEMLYNANYFSDQTNWLIKKRKKELEERFNKAEKFIKNTHQIRFLDIGTGEGKPLIEGIQRGWEVTGIDVVDLRKDEAKKKDIKFMKAKFLEYDFPENYFDFIFIDSVLEHVLTPLDYLKKIKKILKPGGVVYIGVPNEDSLFNDIRRIAFNLTGKKEITEKIKPFVYPYHIVGFNERSLNYLISQLNFKCLMMRNFSRKFNFLGSRINSRGFWVGLLFLFPIEMIGNILKRDYYYELYLSKN